MAETCVAFAVWMPLALLAALGIGVLIGTHIRLGIDRAELVAYRWVARLPPETTANEAKLDRIMEHARALQIARRWRDRARRIAD